MPINTSSARSLRKDFTQDFKMQLFTRWYNLGKPTLERFYAVMVEEDIREPYTKDQPSKNQLRQWVRNEFEAKATFLDHQAAKSIEKSLVADKIKMLMKHAQIGETLYEMGMGYLKENGLGNSRNALSAVIEGLRIERESIGTPIKFTELEKLTDDQLMEELDKMVKTSQIMDILPAEINDQ